MFDFKVVSSEKKARVGKLTTPHGVVETPVFLPVGTQATVKALTPEDLKAVSCQMVLANTYHLYLRPGAEVIAKLGGLHKFMHWDRPILTDSGGFQVFSLGFGIEHEVGKIFQAGEEHVVMGEYSGGRALVPRTKLCKVEEEGPTFVSHIDGSVHFFPPEKSVEVQEKLGADFIVALDECTSPLHDYDYTKVSMERSHRWEKRSLKELKRLKSLKGLFGVVQGGPFEDLRVESAKFVSKNDFFGVGIGGALISRSKMVEILDWINPHLDPEKPRHLLGIGTIPDIFLAVERGVDMFDCVVPTRLARMGKVFSGRETLDLFKTAFKTDDKPIERACDCETCQNYSRAYVHHLFRSRELLAYRLASVHNVAFMMRLMARIRKAISEKKFAKLAADWVKS
ncbi:tRNA guanosine(34) transglycosylase Tgt [Candidatus Microgenomates bacterium]|nr:tRNA guanosine(34) transglycosylase Tgt [Candidatus Microgenomates bacterium]